MCYHNLNKIYPVEMKIAQSYDHTVNLKRISFKTSFMAIDVLINAEKHSVAVSNVRVIHRP